MPNVLIIDNEVQTVELLSQVIELLGHRPTTALGCKAALQSIESQEPDLILLDLMMPEVDGYETMPRIRKLPQGKDVPIVVITASQEVDVEERVAASGGDRVYYKPIGMAMLSEAVEEFVPQ